MKCMLIITVFFSVVMLLLLFITVTLVIVIVKLFPSLKLFYMDKISGQHIKSYQAITAHKRFNTMH